MKQTLGGPKVKLCPRSHSMSQKLRGPVRYDYEFSVFLFLLLHLAAACWLPSTPHESESSVRSGHKQNVILTLVSDSSPSSKAN